MRSKISKDVLAVLRIRDQLTLDKARVIIMAVVVIKELILIAEGME